MRFWRPKPDGITSHAVANAFLAMAPSGALNPMKVNKLVYMAYGRWLLRREGRLCLDAPQVWRYGPIHPEAYEALSGRLNKELPGPVADDGGREPRLDDADHSRIQVVCEVLADFASFSDTQMSTLCHAEGSAWQLYALCHDHGIARFSPLPDDLVRKCFELDPCCGYGPREMRGPSATVVGAEAA